MKEKEILLCLCILQSTLLLIDTIPVNLVFKPDLDLVKKNLLKVVKSMESSVDV